MRAREFWGSRPRKIIAMLDQVKKIETEKMKTIAHLVWGGKLDDEEDAQASQDPTDNWRS